MMKLAAVLCLVLLEAKVMTVSFNQVIEEEFNVFKLQHNKKYIDQSEEQFRMKIYSENREKIAVHNQLYHQGLVNFTMAINQFGDLLPYEYVEMMNGYKISSKSRRGGSTFLSPSHVVLPYQVDWRKEGYVTPVKNQGKCISCWAFSTTGSLEGQHFRKTGKLVSLSEQNLVDCTFDYGNHGCIGGVVDNTFDYIRDNGGVDTEESYPYKAVVGRCNYNAETVGATVVSFNLIHEGSEEELKEVVATVGPVSIVVDADHESFQFYSGGVYSDPACNKVAPGHYALAVGYDTDAKGGDYWIVKNSWGEGWGEKGYIKMARNRKNMCGVATAALYPLV